MEILYLSSGLIVFFLTVYRILAALSDRRVATLQPQQSLSSDVLP
ncbi:MAG: hypothetical protein R3C44_21750 [Chloroflexota bacterium]